LAQVSSLLSDLLRLLVNHLLRKLFVLSGGLISLWLAGCAGGGSASAPTPALPNTPAAASASRDAALAIAAGSSTCANPSIWAGNAPPPCDNNGAFRRVYSGLSYNEASASVVLPVVTTMPTGSPPHDGDTGAAFIESWPGVGSAGSAVGLLYNASQRWYTFYMRSSSGQSYTSPLHYRAGDTVTIYADAWDAFPYYPGTLCTKIPCIDGAVKDITPGCVASGSYVCESEYLINDAGYTAHNCCVFARTTKIQQSPANIFNDGARFGALKWSNAQLCRIGSACAAWVSAGAQDWPNDTSRVEVSGQSATGETDTILLHT
jgi:hypothetical protein